jgi:hypothetical protein
MRAWLSKAHAWPDQLLWRGALIWFYWLHS